MSNSLKLRFRLTLLPLAWLMLCGIERGPKPGYEGFSLGDLQANYEGPSVIPTSFYYLLAFVIAAGVGGFFLLRYIRAKQEQEELDKIVDEQAQLELDTELEARRVSKENREFLRELCDTEDPVELVPVIMSFEEFEKEVEEFKASPRFRAPALAQIFNLRKALGFTIKNSEYAFLCTQMLLNGTKLECQIHSKGKSVAFMTSVLDANETELLIKPPTVKGRPANLKQFPEIACRLRREGDADYDFTLRVLDQITDEMNAVVLEQSKHIRTMRIRQSERISVNIEMDFQLVSEAQYELEKMEEQSRGEHIPITAKVVDMSAGGIKLQISKMPARPIITGDVLVFHLARSSLRQDLAAGVLQVVPRGGLFDLHTTFREMDTLTRIKINQYLDRVQKSEIPQAA
jgi:hypothetical protein